MDILSARSAFRQVQNLHKDFLLRLIDGYSRLQWESFVGRNRSELSGHALHTAREAADFYLRCIEMTANVVRTEDPSSAVTTVPTAEARGF